MKTLFKISEKVSKNSFHLPSGTGLMRKDIDYIQKVLSNYF